MSIIISVFLSSSIGGITQTTNSVDDTIASTEECSCYYKYREYYSVTIDLESLTKVQDTSLVDGNFKSCSKYAHCFKTHLKDSIFTHGKSFVVRNSMGFYIQISDGQNEIKTNSIPVLLPLPNVHQYNINLVSFKNSVILVLSNSYRSRFEIIKYDLNGNE
ncbi:MAG: hypothetical protein HRT57_12480, partial [Crocinitomicaceae bacterium]|nr:hypothetical protein [Crocinitomicaceae bacterium]